MSEYQPPNASDPKRSMPVRTMLAMQAGIVLLALVLGMIFGLDLIAELEFSLAAVNWGMGGALLLLAAGWWLHAMNWRWVEALRRFMREALVPLFRDAPPGTLLMVALLAGVGEELLFRGVIQGGLDGVIGPWPALALASLLFGAMHALSRAYFVLATVMGLYMGLVYLWTGNLLIPILIHFLYDWVVLRYYLASRS
ncbi:type II CAAX prenyl endopeptidase Rce1 family protein [Wenzhouxiangella limi]|uniref:CPBP family intramembrane metalloprotease n=1 Tax=Wenzhouxiangella limi TaxID=2707351 RepID=A0A845VI64_9GAMM|nr:CPBP family intramembrane metalloprotease [Wenzhouxiangella limi]